jgi:hypothetical protein
VIWDVGEKDGLFFWFVNIIQVDRVHRERGFNKMYNSCLGQKVEVSEEKWENKIKYRTMIKVKEQ